MLGETGDNLEMSFKLKMHFESSTFHLLEAPFFVSTQQFLICEVRSHVSSMCDCLNDLTVHTVPVTAVSWGPPHPAKVPFLWRRGKTLTTWRGGGHFESWCKRNIEFWQWWPWTCRQVLTKLSLLLVRKTLVSRIEFANVETSFYGQDSGSHDPCR